MSTGPDSGAAGPGPPIPDLDAYLARVGLDRAPSASGEGLAALHLAHTSAVPFENLAIQAGELPIDLSLPALEEKLVRRRRGGYCFEQNGLFRAVLLALGFDVRACEARVRPPSGELLPRTHMVLVVRDGPRELLADVGFGASGPVLPVPVDGAEHDQWGFRYAVVREGPLRVLRARVPGSESAADLYAFLPEERPQVDFEVANWFTSTWPKSRFVETLTAQLARPDVRRTLRNLSYVERRGAAETAREIGREELAPLLLSDFGLTLPEATRFRALDGPPAEPRRT